MSKAVTFEFSSAICAFIEYEMDTSDRMQAVDLALQISETYNRNFPQNIQGLTTEDLFNLAKSIMDFMRYVATPIA
jgi:hypothetical protein